MDYFAKSIEEASKISANSNSSTNKPKSIFDGINNINDINNNFNANINSSNKFNIKKSQNNNTTNTNNNKNSSDLAGFNFDVNFNQKKK